MSIWKKTSFWGKIKDTISLLGTGGQITLILADSYHQWNYIMGGATIAGILIAMWFDDKNGNGLVDIFETEVTTVIKSDSPISVTTTEETTKQ